MQWRFRRARPSMWDQDQDCPSKPGFTPKVSPPAVRSWNGITRERPLSNGAFISGFFRNLTLACRREVSLPISPKVMGLLTISCRPETPCKPVFGNTWGCPTIKPPGRRVSTSMAVVADSNLGVFEPETSYNLFLGRRPAGDGTTSFNGLLDEVAIYNRALSQTEIQGIYNAGSAGKCSAPPALLDLISTIGSANLPRNRQPLLAILAAARESITLANVKSAINQLRAFQNKVRAQVVPQAPALGATLSLAAQQIINELDPSGTLRVAAAAPVARDRERQRRNRSRRRSPRAGRRIGAASHSLSAVLPA